MSTDPIDLADSPRMNWTNIIAFGLFHVGAVAALFMFSWQALAVALFLLLDVYRPGHQHGLPSAAHSPVVSSTFGARVLFCCLWYADPRRRADFLGCDTSNPPPEIRSARRSALTA